MSPLVTNLVFAALTAIAIGIGVAFWRSRRQLLRRVQRLSEEMLAASRDASVGHRLTIPNDPDTAQIAHTVNRLFDALADRDEKIQDRDRLFKDFSRTLPEIVLIHDEKIILANESAASLVGLEPAQLVGREAADLVKPAYRALFRKTLAKHLTGEGTPDNIEVQLINGNQTGFWVEAQSSRIEFHGHTAILTVDPC